MSMSLNRQHAGVIRRVALSLIDRMENARQIDRENLIRLTRNIQTHGLLHPLVVVPMGLRFLLIAGNHRFLALIDLQATEAPCLVLPEGTPLEDALAYSLSENHARIPESLRDTFRRVTYLMKSHGCTNRAAAAKLCGLSEGQLSKIWFAVDNLSPAALSFATENAIGSSVCYEIARRTKKHSSEQLALLQDHHRGALTRDQIADGKTKTKSAKKTRQSTPKSLKLAAAVGAIRVRLEFPRETANQLVLDALDEIRRRLDAHIASEKPVATFSMTPARVAS